MIQIITAAVRLFTLVLFCVVPNQVVSLYFDAPPAAKNSMELALRLDEQVRG